MKICTRHGFQNASNEQTHVPAVFGTQQMLSKYLVPPSCTPFFPISFYLSQRIVLMFKKIIRKYLNYKGLFKHKSDIVLCLSTHIFLFIKCMAKWYNNHQEINIVPLSNFLRAHMDFWMKLYIKYRCFEILLILCIQCFFCMFSFFIQRTLTSQLTDFSA